jgi:transposase
VSRARAEDTSSGDDAPAAPGGAAIIVALQAGNVLLRSENIALTARIAELERRLGLNSSNSGKQPSSDGLKKPARVSSLREPFDRKTGGQKGHPGETLRRIETPDIAIDHYPHACTTCGAALTAQMAADHVARQVFDIPEPQPLIVTEHRAHAVARSAARRRGRHSPKASPRRYSMASGSARSCSICCTISCCPRSALPRPWRISSVCIW